MKCKGSGKTFESLTFTGDEMCRVAGMACAGLSLAHASALRDALAAAMLCRPDRDRTMYRLVDISIGKGGCGS
ncbi:hypothetical protein RR46_05811 [Papilio xuthus]|uniref:Uncharacterized protein n=1 Tax=Papilio xuthus TaxID=66420 RepID=I4DQH7_PAPXU|nr:hypothetical protein RR46_05811 [Papilio xuthus]BAM20167.1 unknown unsecreted protein [Papilio xuthus]